MQNTEPRFALTNPMTIITGKDPKDLTRDDIIRVIIEKQIERITFHYTAIDGKLKELRTPITNLKQVELLLTEGERVDGSSLFKGIIEASSSDLYVVPEYKTAFFNPFDPHSIDFVCRFFDADGNLATFTPDNILHKAAKQLKKSTGYELYAMGELEFYIVGSFDNSSYPAPAQKGYHSSSPFVKTGDILNEMLRNIAKITGNVKYAHHEVGCLDNIQSECEELSGKQAEQVEIEFLPTPVEDTGDILTISKWIIRNIAHRHNCIATFVPKLEVGHAGSGMHFHMELMKHGKNIMTDEKGDLSTQALAVIGGLCHYAPSLTAYGNMVAASYLRLVPHQEAPTRVCWSERNRSALIRVPLGWSNVDNLTQKINPQQTEKLKHICNRQTVELRSPDGSAFTHLILAGIAMAAEWGLVNEKESLDITSKCHATCDVQDMPNKDQLADIATSCSDSADILLKNRQLYERENIFTHFLVDGIAKMLKDENDGDLNERLMAMPEEQKMIESRKIMHRDIHKH